MHIDHRNQNVADDDGIGNALSRTAKQTEKTGQNAQHHRKDDLAERRDRRP